MKARSSKLSPAMRNALLDAEANKNGVPMLAVLVGAHPRTIQALADRGLAKPYGNAGDFQLTRAGWEVRSILADRMVEAAKAERASEAAQVEQASEAQPASKPAKLNRAMRTAILNAERAERADGGIALILRGVHPRTIQALDSRGLLVAFGNAGDVALSAAGWDMRHSLRVAEREAWEAERRAEVTPDKQAEIEEILDLLSPVPVAEIIDQARAEVAQEWRVPTTELNEGDVINNHGMLLRLENRARYVDTRTRETVITFDGVVTNMPDVTDAFMRQCALEDGTPERPVWRVQGNRLATWRRVSKAAQTPVTLGTSTKDALAAQEEYLKRSQGCRGVANQIHSYRPFGAVGVGEAWSACVVCGVTETQDDYAKRTKAAQKPVKLGPLDSRPRSPRAAMVATDTRTGGLVSIGDKVTNFRGEVGYLTYISRAAVPGKSGKVCVASKPGDTTGAREYYDNVWNLAVSTLRPCGCVITAKQDDCTHP